MLACSAFGFPVHDGDLSLSWFPHPHQTLQHRARYHRHLHCYRLPRLPIVTSAGAWSLNERSQATACFRSDVPSLGTMFHRHVNSQSRRMIWHKITVRAPTRRSLLRHQSLTLASLFHEAAKRQLKLPCHTDSKQRLLSCHRERSLEQKSKFLWVLKISFKRCTVWPRSSDLPKLRVGLRPITTTRTHRTEASIFVEAYMLMRTARARGRARCSIMQCMHIAIDNVRDKNVR